VKKISPRKREKGYRRGRVKKVWVTNAERASAKGAYQFVLVGDG